MISPAGGRPGQPPGPPVWAWHAVAAAGALAAIAVLAVYSAAMFVAAAALAAGAGGMAEWESQLRSRGRPSDLGGLLTTVLAVSFVMILVLTLADNGRR